MANTFSEHFESSADQYFTKDAPYKTRLDVNITLEEPPKLGASTSGIRDMALDPARGFGQKEMVLGAGGRFKIEFGRTISDFQFSYYTWSDEGTAPFTVTFMHQKKYIAQLQIALSKKTVVFDNPSVKALAFDTLYITNSQESSLHFDSFRWKA